MGRRKRVHYAEPVSIEIGGLGEEGLGEAEVGGRAARVLGALPGETVRARHRRRRRGVDLFTVEALESAGAPVRTRPDCAAFGRCGGCVLQHLAGDEQLRFKQQAVMARFRDAGLEPGRWLAPLQSPTRGYRYKARLGVRSVVKKDRVLVGFREFGTGWVTDTAACTILHPAVGERIAEISELIGAMDAARRIPQVEVSAGDEEVALVFRHLDPLTAADRARLEAFAAATGLLVFLQGAGPESITPLLAEQPRELHYDLPAEDLRMHFLPSHFTQVNPAMNRTMVSQALRELDPQPGDHVLDLFCGIGNFSLPLARHCDRVTGVEGSAQLVGQARENADRNAVGNVSFTAADLYASAMDLPWDQWSCDRLLLDPPRTGAEDLVAHIGELSPRRIVYVSCNPVTLVRDSSVLAGRGYRLEAAGIMDMFPHTAHVEAMAVFSRAA